MNAIAIIPTTFVETTYGAVPTGGPASLFFTDPDLASAHYKGWAGAYNISAGAVSTGFNPGSVVYQLG